MNFVRFASDCMVRDDARFDLQLETALLSLLFVNKMNDEFEVGGCKLGFTFLVRRRLDKVDSGLEVPFDARISTFAAIVVCGDHACSC